MPLPLLVGRELHPRFFRTQLLTALGLTVVASLWEWSRAPGTTQALIGLAVALLIAGSVIWTLEPPPAGKTVISATLFTLAGLVMFPTWDRPGGPWWLVAADGLASALTTGSALTAMLVGHSYLISPGMTLRPLMRMLALFAGSLVIRALLGGIVTAQWSGTEEGQLHWPDLTYWLPLRWLVGIIAPGLFALMAYLAARIRSTQSATGILYVVVICVFLGEMIALITQQSVKYPL